MFFSFFLEQCSNWHRKPDVFVPLDNKTSVNAVKGSNISIQCQAFFGNCYSEECYITWLRIFSSNCCSLDLNMNAANESFENCGRNYTILGFNDDNRVRTVETKMKYVLLYCKVIPQTYSPSTNSLPLLLTVHLVLHITGLFSLKLLYSKKFLNIKDFLALLLLPLFLVLINLNL